ncbi:hypothetical protein DMP17_22095 [Pseudonocardia sp. TMWB2A]|uniref:hypothetical protein n=1 Tax=Pseudonocardia sp. TMWB2A TaxID=687430 RepID=UPI00307E6D58
MNDVPDGLYLLIGSGPEPEPGPGADKRRRELRELRGRTVRFERNVPVAVWLIGGWAPLSRGQVALVRAYADCGALAPTWEPVPRVRKATDELRELRAMEASIRRVCRDRRMRDDRGDVVLVADIEAVLPL